MVSRLRTIGLLLGFTLATLVARVVIDGPTLLVGVTAAVILAFLLGTLRIWQQLSRLRPSTRDDGNRVGVRQ